MSTPKAPTIAILNASSRTASHLIPLALSNGSTVHALVRSASRLSPSLTSPEPPANLHVHELACSPPTVDSLRPILATTDFLLITFTAPDLVAPTTLNQDAIIAATAAIRANTPTGETPRTRIILLSSELVHPDIPSDMMTRFARGLLSYQMDDLDRSRRYLAQQAAWGLGWTAVSPGMIVENAKPETEKDKLDSVKVVPGFDKEIKEKPISYGQLGAAIWKVVQNWEKADGKCVTPVPLGAKVSGRSDVDKIVKAWGSLFVRKVVAWGFLTAAGWEIGRRYGGPGIVEVVQGFVARLRGQ